jgi:hypothetical protein
VDTVTTATERLGIGKVHGSERVRVTVLDKGDKVMVQIDTEMRHRDGERRPVDIARFSRSNAPKRAFWATVVSVKRVPGQRSVQAVIVSDRVGQQWRIDANSMFMCTRAL